jgi:hypothetical protein
MSIVIERVRAAAAAATDHQEKQGAEDTEARRITDVMERFLQKQKRVIYGGAAINAQLPAEHKFYDPRLYLPDYDFMTPTPIQDAEELMEDFRKEGFKEIETKFGIHEGTYKVFVNFRSAADITYMPLDLYKRILKDCRVVNRLFYASPNFLRMNMYLELSRPAGMVSRWEKVYQRLLLLNEAYPLHVCGVKGRKPSLMSDLQQQIVDEGAAEGAIFLSVRGLRPLSAGMEPIILMMTDKAAALSSSLRELGLTEIRHEAQGELLPARSEFKSEGALIAVVFATVACHAYTTVADANKRTIRLASIDLLIQMYYALYFMELKHYVPDSILCTIQRLIEMEARQRSHPATPLKEAFPLDCIGHQPTMPELKRAHRSRLLDYKKKQRKTKKVIKGSKGRQLIVKPTQ